MQGLPRRFVLTSIVYVGAVLLLLCLAIFAGSFTRTMGDARISGRYSPFPLFNRSRLEALTLSWNGLDLSFSRTSDPALVRLDSSQDSADILLTGDERLHLSLTGNRGSALTISPVQPWPATASVITIPFKVSGVLEDREDGKGSPGGREDAPSSSCCRRMPASTIIRGKLRYSWGGLPALPK